MEKNSLFETEPIDLYRYERMAKSEGYHFIAGIDEVGRGALAGPVVAAAVILQPEHPVDGVNDSKKLSRKLREALFDIIVANAVSVGIDMVDAAQIDKINILQATRLAMLQAVQGLSIQPDYLLIDGITTIESPFPQRLLKQGDSRAASIAAASIIAKVTRDRLLCEYASTYQEYGFDKHKGYGTASHISSLQKYGPTPIHRLSFAKVPQTNGC